MSEKNKVLTVTWNGALQISKDDEIEITRAILHRDETLTAFKIHNKTTGRTEISPREGILDIVMPVDISPPIEGIVQEITGGELLTLFTIAEKVGILEVNLKKLVHEIEPCLDREIAEKCVHKEDPEDVVTSGFRILEERIRRKTGANASIHGVDLIDEAFHPDRGKLIFGKTDAERLGTFMLFRGAFLIFRNPPSHRYFDEYKEFEIFEIATLANLLLNILEKSQLRKA